MDEVVERLVYIVQWPIASDKLVLLQPAISIQVRQPQEIYPGPCGAVIGAYQSPVQQQVPAVDGDLLMGRQRTDQYCRVSPSRTDSKA